MGLKIIITGEKTHDIGYRYFLMESALAHGIERFSARNLREEAEVVQVLVEGDKEALEQFYDFVKTTYPEEAKVKKITAEEYKGYIPKIESFALVFNVGQSRKFIKIGRSVDGKLDKIDGKLDRIDNRLESMDGKLDKIDGKLDRIDNRLESMDGKLDKTNKLLEARFSNLEKEIERIKKALIRAGIEV